MSARGDEPEPVMWESGIEVKTVYAPADVEASGGTDGIGGPGEFPFTRGIHPLMYRKRPWTMRQYAGFGTAAETRERFLYLLSRGQTGLNVAFDLPTQCGFDSDDPMADGEVGRVGMPVDTLADLETAFEDVDLARTTVSLTINGAAVPLMAMFFALAKKRGIPLAELRGTAQNDIVKEFIGRGTWIYPVEASVKLVADTMEFCAREVPHYSPVSVCGYHIRESGASPAEEMAYAIAIACAYLDRATARGLSVDAVAPGLSFNFNVHGNLWEQVAKFRAGRRLWARTVRERYRATDPRSMQLRMIAGGGGGGLTAHEPENNIARGAYYALASALGGTQTMALCCFDEAYTIPSEKASRVALRTMQILMHEAGGTDTVDPLAGSYFIETTTNQMEGKIREALQRIEGDGGIVAAVADGRAQAAVNRRAWETHRRFERGETKKVGVNFLVDPDAPSAGSVEMHPYRDDAAKAQIESLGQIRAKRDGSACAAALAALRSVAEAGGNVMPASLSAAEAYASVGEICSVLRGVYGTYREQIRW